MFKVIPDIAFIFRRSGIMVLTVLLLFGKDAMPQVAGCTDPQANNYNPVATINDGSCEYEPTAFTPPVLFNLPIQINETSGLIFWDNGLWSHNDSGGDPVLYKVDTSTGEIIRWVKIDNALNVDWEDIAQDADHIYVGDFGNNPGNRKDLNIIVIAKEDILMGSSDTVHVSGEEIWFTYEDQTVFTSSQNNHNYDCEAMIVVEDSLYLFSKNWVNKYTRIYRLPKVPGTYEAIVIDSLNVNCLVTGADYFPETGFITLTAYNFFIPMFWMFWDYQGHDFFSGNKRLINMPALLGAQTEGVSIISEDELLISAEKTDIFDQSVYEVDYGQWAGALTSLAQLIPSEEEIRINPNPVNQKLIIEMPCLEGAEPKIAIMNQMGAPCDIIYRIFTTTDEGCRTTIDVSHLKSGFYAVKVQYGPVYKTGKLIKN